MDKNIIFAVSTINKKYYFSEITEKLPFTIKEEIKVIGVKFVEKVGGVFSIGFYEDGSLFFETTGDNFDYDDIGAKLEIEKIKKENKELISSLQVWYKLFLANVL